METGETTPPPPPGAWRGVGAGGLVETDQHLSASPRGQKIVRLDSGWSEGRGIEEGSDVSEDEGEGEGEDGELDVPRSVGGPRRTQSGEGKDAKQGSPTGDRPQDCEYTCPSSIQLELDACVGGSSDSVDLRGNDGPGKSRSGHATLVEAVLHRAPPPLPPTFHAPPPPPFSRSISPPPHADLPHLDTDPRPDLFSSPLTDLPTLMMPLSLTHPHDHHTGDPSTAGTLSTTSSGFSTHSTMSFSSSSSSSSASLSPRPPIIPLSTTNQLDLPITPPAVFLPSPSTDASEPTSPPRPDLVVGIEPSPPLSIVMPSPGSLSQPRLMHVDTPALPTSAGEQEEAGGERDSSPVEKGQGYFDVVAAGEKS